MLKYLKKKEIEDIIIFGSFLKGKENIKDIDITIVFKKFSKTIWQDINKIGDEYHFSKTTFSKLLIEPLFWQTLLHEGYSLKHEEFISNILGMKSSFLFEYELLNLDKIKKQTFSGNMLYPVTNMSLPIKVLQYQVRNVIIVIIIFCLTNLFFYFSHALYGTGGRANFLKNIKGEKIGRNSILIAEEYSEEMRSFLDTWNVIYKVRRIFS